MKKLLLIPLVLLVAFVAFAAYVADRLLGVVAFTFGYLAFCLLAALAFGALSYPCFGKRASLVVLVVFGLLAANFFLPPPSERLLRSALLKAPPGTDAAAIETIVKRAYEDSPYAIPRISKDRAGNFDRVHVSLLSQEERSCTSLVFLIEDGRVMRSFFSPD